MTQHRATCHCGNVALEFDADIQGALSCNCSICSKKGSILAFAPRGEFRLLSGESDLADYLFNKHVINHRFCRTCGVESFAFGTRPNGQEMAAINVRCLDGVDVAALNPVPFDGRSL